MQKDTPSRLVGYARPSQNMSFVYEISTFRQNDQVRVVTRSLSCFEVVRGPSASPRLSQDAHSIPKPPRLCAAVLSFLHVGRVDDDQCRLGIHTPVHPPYTHLWTRPIHTCGLAPYTPVDPPHTQTPNPFAPNPSALSPKPLLWEHLSIG